MDSASVSIGLLSDFASLEWAPYMHAMSGTSFFGKLIGGRMTNLHKEGLRTCFGHDGAVATREAFHFGRRLPSSTRGLWNCTLICCRSCCSPRQWKLTFNPVCLGHIAHGVAMHTSSAMHKEAHHGDMQGSGKGWCEVV